MSIISTMINYLHSNILNLLFLILIMLLFYLVFLFYC